MVCRECGTRNLPDEDFCRRCGADLKVVKAAPGPSETAPAPESEERVAEVRACLEKGDLKRAMDLAREAVVNEPEAALSYILLGDVYLRIEANDDALRAFRDAAELDSDNVEAREKAEEARKRIVQSEIGEPTTPDLLSIGPLRIHRKLIPYAVGAAAALLVFSVGAATIVSRTSPTVQRTRSFEQQMAAGSEHYRAGRYREAAAAYTQAVRLDPSSEQARRRLRDAQAMAGLRPPASEGVVRAQQPVLGPTTTPGQGAFAPRWVGPSPGSATPPNPPTGPSTARRSTPPPPIPVPDPTGVSGIDPVLPPPIPPSGTEGIGDPDQTGTRVADIGIGREFPTEEPGTEATAREHALQPTQPQQPRGEIVIERVVRRTPTTSPETTAATQATPTTGEALRSEADRLRRSGRLKDAARKYGEAATQLRLEADQSGPDAATKKAAATTCERAREACESQLQ